MIRKLAEELAYNDTLQVSEAQDNPAPLEEPSPPPFKEGATPSPEYGFTEHSTQKHEQSQGRFLDRALNRYRDAGLQHEEVLTRVLGDHVKRVSGSSLTSQLATSRFRNR